jgi:DNA-binding protein H-NS
MAKASDLSALSIEELESQAAQLQEVLQEKLKAQRDEALARIKADVVRFKFSLEDLGFASAATPGKAKKTKPLKVEIPAGKVLVDPGNAANTYTVTGKAGRRPRWLSNYLNAGGSWQDISQ